MMDKREETFQKVLFDFIALLPIRISEEDGNFVWKQETKNCYYRNYSWTKSKRVLEECGIVLNEDFHRGPSNGHAFLYVNMNSVNVGEGWISFQGNDISTLYDHWDKFDGWPDECQYPDGKNLSSLKKLFAQYLDTLNDWVDDLDIDYCVERFGMANYLAWQKKIQCIDDYLHNFEKYYVFQTYISKANFLKICKNDSYLRLGATRNGELVWDILDFVKNSVDFSDCYIDVSDNTYFIGDRFNSFEADCKLARELYNVLHFEPYAFGKKSKKKVLELTPSFTAQHLNLSYPKADDDVSCLKKSLTELVNNGEKLFEIKEYQSRFFPQIVRLYQRNCQILTFVEDASHISDYSYNKACDAHRSFLIVSKAKQPNITKIILIPSNEKYASYVFQVMQGFGQIAVALIAGYFSSCIENKRECLLIKSLFQDFGIVTFRRS